MNIQLSAPTPYIASLSPPETATASKGRMSPEDAERIAQGFESLLLAQVLKEMRQTLQQGGMFAGDSGDVQGGMFDLFMSQHLAQAGGVGIAAMLKQQLMSAKSP